MENTIKLLVSIAQELDDQGLIALSSRVDAVTNNMINIKTAQYVGIQGYAIRNSRCWGNCYRKKRVENPKKAAQAVWTECHKEYVESINNDGSKWDKYAYSNESFVKTASVSEEKYKYIDKEIAKIISDKLTYGLDIGNAIFASIDEISNLPQEHSVASSNELLDIASEIIVDTKMSNKIIIAAQSVIKESGFFDGIGNAVGNAWNGAKFDYNIGSNLGDVDKAVNSVVQSLTQMNSSKQKLLSFLQNFKPRTQQQQQSLQTSIQGMQTFNVVDPNVVNAKWQKIRQAITLGTNGSQSSAAGASQPAMTGTTPATVDGTSPVPAAGATATTPTPIKTPKGNNVPIPSDVKSYLNNLPMNQLKRIINDAKYMRTAYNANRIKESQVPVPAANPAAPVVQPAATQVGARAKPRAVQDQIHFLRDLPPNVRKFLESLKTDQLQAVLNDIEADKYAWSSVDKRRNFVR